MSAGLGALGFQRTQVPPLFPASRVPAPSAVCSRHSRPSASAPHFGRKLMTTLPVLKQPHYLPPQHTLGPVTPHSHRSRVSDGDTFGRRCSADQAPPVFGVRGPGASGAPRLPVGVSRAAACPPVCRCGKCSEVILSAPARMHWAPAECPLGVTAGSVTTAPGTGHSLGAGSDAFPASRHRRHREAAGRHPAIPLVRTRKWGSGKLTHVPTAPVTLTPAVCPQPCGGTSLTTCPAVSRLCS